MRNSVMTGLIAMFCAALSLFAQAVTPAAPMPPSPEQIQQQRTQALAQLQQLQQQLEALGGNPATPELIQQLQQASQALGQVSGRGGRGGRGGFPAGGFGGPGGGRGAAAAAPAVPVAAGSAPNNGMPVVPKPCEPSNPDMTAEARALLHKLCDITGKGILTGQHNFPNQRNLDTDRIHEATGYYPAIWGSDFGFTEGEDKDAITHRDLMIAEAKKQYAAGSIIYFCWHMLRPTEDEPGKPGASWGGSVQAKLTEEQWQELISSDSPLHKRWEKYMDTAAVYLKQLQDAGIPVLWRPMHENNGTFFWWGGHPGPYGTALLYREVYNRMVHVHHLNNLVWVWNQNGPAPGGEFYNYFPGKAYCDVVSYDNYRTLDDRFYHEILTIADGKPIGLGEVGSIPSPETLKAQPKWSFFMTWSSGQGPSGNTATDAERRKQLVQQLADVQTKVKAAGTEPATPELQQQVMQLTQQLSQFTQKENLKKAYSNPYLMKRGDPLPN